MCGLRVLGVIGLLVIVVVACYDAPTTAPEASTDRVPAAPPGPGYSSIIDEAVEYPLHYSSIIHLKSGSIGIERKKPMSQALGRR